MSCYWIDVESWIKHDFHLQVFFRHFDWIDLVLVSNLNKPHIEKNYWRDWSLGLPEIFGIADFRLQTGNWPKTWRYAKFQVNPRLFYHVRSAPKTSGLPIKMASGGRFRGSTDVVKRPGMDLKLGIPSRFGPISSLELEAWDPENFGQP